MKAAYEPSWTDLNGFQPFITIIKKLSVQPVNIIFTYFSSL